MLPWLKSEVVKVKELVWLYDLFLSVALAVVAGVAVINPLIHAFVSHLK